MSKPQVQLSKKNIKTMKEGLVLPLLTIIGLSLFDTHYFLIVMYTTTREAIKQL